VLAISRRYDCNGQPRPIRYRRHHDEAAPHHEFAFNRNLWTDGNRILHHFSQRRKKFSTGSTASRSCSCRQRNSPSSRRNSTFVDHLLEPLPIARSRMTSPKSLIQLTLPFQSDCLSNVMSLQNTPSISTISWPVFSFAPVNTFAVKHAGMKHAAAKTAYMAAGFAAVNTKRSPQRLRESLT